MAQNTYQVIVSTDGKHTVIATSEDVTSVKAAVAWAKTTYDQLVTSYGLKHEQYTKNGEPNGKEAVPVCAVHNLPMTKQKGEYGYFWSCHQRNEDGSFCSYRPDGK